MLSGSKDEFGIRSLNIVESECDSPFSPPILSSLRPNPLIGSLCWALVLNYSVRYDVSGPPTAFFFPLSVFAGDLQDVLLRAGSGVIDRLNFSDIGSIRLQFAKTDFIIQAPIGVLEIVDSMMTHVVRSWSKTSIPCRVEVTRNSDGWKIDGRNGTLSTIAATNAMPIVASAVVSALLSELADRGEVCVLRGTALERDGQGLVIFGDDLESCVTLSTQLHVRGWRILGSDHALIFRDSLVVTPFRNKLSANSLCTPAFPQQYRAAIEASPWYSLPWAVSFYGIDPTLVDRAAPWGEDAPFRAALKIDGSIAEHPSLESMEKVPTESGLSPDDFARGKVETASLTLGNYIETCDFVERWFSTIPVLRLVAS